jgi:peptidoglycan hydrolase-like protein with peptidoglycan-binding domain
MAATGLPFRGRFRLGRRTIRMVAAAEKRGGPLTVTQGGFNPGGVGASGGTHDLDGVLDFSVRGLTAAQINRRVRALREVGFAAWLRTPDEGPWGAHIHAVAVGEPNLAPVAARQVSALRAGRNGLRSNRLDRHRGMRVPVRTFEDFLASLARSKDLRRGDTGAEVKALQRALGVRPDGQFGPVTEAALNRVKARHGWPQDGIAGPRVREALELEEVA